MPKMPDDDVLWIAQRHGQDWRDEDVLSAVSWLLSLVPQSDGAPRAAAVEARFQSAKLEWAEGSARTALRSERRDSVVCPSGDALRGPCTAAGLLPPRGLPHRAPFSAHRAATSALMEMDGGEARATRLMTENIAQPDDGIYELLVAGAYARRGWDMVRFVPEAPGVEKRHDLEVERPGSSWGVECKRAGRSGYAKDERLAAERIAERAHALSRSAAAR